MIRHTHEFNVNMQGKVPSINWIQYVSMQMLLRENYVYDFNSRPTLSCCVSNCVLVTLLALN